MPTSLQAAENVVETVELIANTHMLILHRAATSRADVKTSGGWNFKGEIRSANAN